MSVKHNTALEAENRQLREQLTIALCRLEALACAAAPFATWQQARRRPSTGDDKVSARRRARERDAFVGASTNHEGERVGATGADLEALATEYEAAVASIEVDNKGLS